MAFSKIVGEVLRAARGATGLTLQEVHRRSRGRFKPSALGGYERGERAISLPRFYDLAGCYGIPADRLLIEILTRLSPQTRKAVIVDTGRLGALEQHDEARAVADFVHRLKVQRGDYLSDVITLRAGDLEAIALDSGSTPRDLMKALQPALVGADDRREK